MNLLILLLATTAVAAVGAHTVIVHTPAGDVMGLENEATQEFLGIPFAQPPTGPLRWKPPQRLAPTPTAIINATAPSASCPNAAWAPSPLCQTCSTRTNYPRIPNSEDCLYLNVVVPKSHKNNNELLPVMVFIHGGGGTVGAASPYAMATRAMADRRVILVAPNYRLGALGWMAHEKLSSEQDGCSGNYAVLDNIAALQWVQDNIESFGGDRTRVTVFGQSYGGSAMHYLLLSPLAKGLFGTVIAESGDLDWEFQELAVVERDVGAKMLTVLGCAAGDLVCARNASWESVMDAKGVGQVTPSVCRPNNNKKNVSSTFPGMPWELLRNGEVNRVTLVSGHNAHEGGLTDYFSTLGIDHFDALYDTNTTEGAARLVQDATSTISRSDGSAGGAQGKKHTPQEVADAAHYALNTLYPAATTSSSSSSSSFSSTGDNGYERITRLRTGSGEALASYAWAREWHRLGLPSFHYEFDGSAEGSPAMRPFGAMHLLELTYVLDRPDLITNHTFTENEEMLAHTMGNVWTEFAKKSNKDADEDDQHQFASMGSGKTGGLVTNVIGNDGSIAHVENWQKEQMDFFWKWEGVERV